jgi:hypothetical protein
MKSTQWFILSTMLLFVMVTCLVVGALVSYGYMLPKTFPETIVLTREVVVEQQVPFEVIKTVEVEVIKEVVVEVTPIPQVLEITAPPPTAEQPACTNIAWVVSQPKSDLQAGALEIGRGKRLIFRLRNEGTCTWDGYLLTSAGVFPDLEVPYTEPGQTATIEYTFQVYKSLVARFMLQAPTMSGLFGLMNSASPGVGEESIYYRLDVYKGSTIIQIPPELGGGTLECGPGG